MRDADLSTLEFPQLADAVAAHAASSCGREACALLRPLATLDEAREELARVADFCAITERERPPIGDFPDIRPALAVARTSGAQLSGLELKAVAAVVATVRATRGFLRAAAAEHPRLLAFLERLHALPDLARLLDDALDDEGGLRDDASPALRALRRELRELRAEIEARLARLFRRSGAQHAIADEYVTVRNGRFVVPVRAQAASELPGIVQDRSASGETLFVEPLFAVEHNNRLLIAAREEAQEEARILAEITSTLGACAGELEAAFAALVELDTLGARAGFARRHAAVCPRLGAEEVSLRDARHPLLALTGRAVTPIDVLLDPATRVLVVTGPNTGGKSVALKTLGLFAFMAQSGIPILAREDAALPWFDWVWCDIGDQQSVAADLSTFSGHVANLAEILSGATGRSLVLLDEPGTGTDPDDGAALAKATLRELAARGARVLATSHFHAVKVMALTSPGLRTAGVDFDPETFSPRYRLVYDSVGPSLGLTMARRLGLPATVLDAAERERGGHAADVTSAIAQLEAERRRYEAEAERCERERIELHAARHAQETLAAELREKKARKWSDELAEARRFAEDLRREGRRLLAEAKRSPASFARSLEQLGAAQAALVAEKSAALTAEREPPRTPTPRRPLAVGDQVEVVGSGLRGAIVKLSGARAQIARGALRFDVPTAQLLPAGGTARSRPTSAGHGTGDEPPRPSQRRGGVDEETGATAGAAPAPLVTSEINLVGERVRDALARLEPFLDRAVLEERSAVRIIHGFGTGALRTSVHEFLARSPHVERFAAAGPEAGGGGATIAYLR